MRYFITTILVLVALTGCQATPQLAIHRPVLEQRRQLAESIAVRDPRITIKRAQDVSPSVFGYNPRRWQPAGLQDHLIPIKWLQGRSLSDQIYVVKHVGKSALFCLIKPDALSMGKHGRKKSAEYSLFLLKRVQKTKAQTLADVALQHYPGDPLNHREIQIGKMRAVQVNWNTEQFWSAPIVFAETSDGVYEMTLLYHGLKRGYVMQLMNKFPWRAFASR